MNASRAGSSVSEMPDVNGHFATNGIFDTDNTVRYDAYKTTFLAILLSINVKTRYLLCYLRTVSVINMYDVHYAVVDTGTYDLHTFYGLRLPVRAR